MQFKYINLSKFYNAILPYLKIRLILRESFPKKRVLVISPHIDDDILGAGGSIYKHISSGGDVSVVYLAGTDKARIEEAQQVQEIVKYRKMYFWEYQSDKIGNYPEIVEKISELLSLEKPELVLTPFLIDNHRDHISTNKFLIEAIKQNKYQFDVFSYEVWTPLYPNFIIDISDVIEIKEKCISIYESQLKDHDYIDQSISLNRFRGATIGKKVKYAEAFLHLPADLYVTLWNKIYA